MIKIVGVRFRNAGKVYYFDPMEFTLRIGDHVIVETSKGPEYGAVSTGLKPVEDDQVSQPLRSVLRVATGEDEEKVKQMRVKEKEALKVCREKVRDHELDMKVVDAEYAFDGSKMLFYFTADGRVDFRELVKDLAGVFHMRIELRQIGVRDETRMLGGIGTCGRELCCATYLREFQPVSIKMAKEQNLSLNPAKISGTCGRLMCCLKNEEDTYEFLNAKMPKLGAEAITADGQSGKVIELDVLRQRVRVLFEEGDEKEVEVFPVDQLTFQPRKKNPPQEKAKGKKEERARDDAGSREKGKRDGRRDQSRSLKESPEGQGEGQQPQSADAAEHKKRTRRRRHKADGAQPHGAEGRAAGSAGEVSRESRTREPGIPQEKAQSPEGHGDAGDAGEKSAARKRRRRRPHRGPGERPSDGQEGGQQAEARQPKTTGEMKIYADRGSHDE